MKAITALMRATMKKAVLKGYIRINPYDYDYRVPKGAIPEPTERLVSDADIKALMAACKDNERFSVIIPLLLLTGVRIGALLALHWTDIDFDNRLIKVNKSVQIAYRELPTGEIERNGVCIGTPKSASSYRDIPVSNTVIKILVDWLVMRDDENHTKWKSLIEDNDNCNLVFPNYQGRIMNYETLYGELKEFLKRNNLDKCKILFHKLRHNYATNLVDCGVDIIVVSKLMGHKSIQTTTSNYAKVRMQPNIDAIRKHDVYMHSIGVV